MLKKKTDLKKTSITFRVSSDLYNRYQKLKKDCRIYGYVFALQDDIEKVIEKEVQKAERELDELAGKNTINADNQN
jgi:hypothetical protein